MTRHFLRDDDVTPAEQAEILDLAVIEAGYRSSLERRRVEVVAIYRGTDTGSVASSA